MKPTPLGHHDIRERLAALPGWQHRGDAIERVFDRGDFNGSLHFVNAVGEAANKANHHPDITIHWNRVTLTLSSHDAGGLTQRDFDLAKIIDALANPE
jgi:4a-hydroxytetrahydrobiopterin dehydratase